MSSLGEIFVTIRAVNETAATYADVRSSAALMASTISGSPVTLHVENLASPEIGRVAKEAASVKAGIEASPIAIEFEPITVPSIPPIEVSPIETNFAPVELPIIPPIESPIVTVNFSPIEVPSIPLIEPPTIPLITIPPPDISEITAQFEAVSSDAARIASTVSGLPITLNVENLASPEINRVREDAAGVKAEVEASPITITFEPVIVPSIPPIEVPVIEAHFGLVEPPILPPIENPTVTVKFASIEVPSIPPIETTPIQTSFAPIEPPAIPPIENPVVTVSFTPIEVPPLPLVDTTPIQASLNEVGVAATEMGENVRASALSFDEMGAHAESTVVSLRTIAGGIRTFSMMGMELTTVATDFGILDRETAKYVRGLMAVVMIVSTAARMYSFLTLMTSGHTAALAINTTTETAGTGATIASTIVTNIKTAATWIATAAQSALNISYATFLALTGVGIAVIVAAAAAMWYFTSQMNAATASVKQYNTAAAETPAATSGIGRSGQQAMIRRGVE